MQNLYFIRKEETVKAYRTKEAFMEELKTTGSFPNEILTTTIYNEFNKGLVLAFKTNTDDYTEVFYANCYLKDSNQGIVLIAEDYVVVVGKDNNNVVSAFPIMGATDASKFKEYQILLSNIDSFINTSYCNSGNLHLQYGSKKIELLSFTIVEDLIPDILTFDTVEELYQTAVTVSFDTVPEGYVVFGKLGSTLYSPKILKVHGTDTFVAIAGQPRPTTLISPMDRKKRLTRGSLSRSVFELAKNLGL